MDNLRFKKEEIQRKLFTKICDEIIVNMVAAKKLKTGDLSDISSEVARAVAMHTCEDKKEKGIWGFKKDDFESGFDHGYSLFDGRHFNMPTVCDHFYTLEYNGVWSCDKCGQLFSDEKVNCG